MRFRSKPLVALSILLVLTGALGGWHAPDDMEDAAPAAHKHADHDARFATPTEPTAPEHCVFCHSLRTLGTGAPVATPVLNAELGQFTRVGKLDSFIRTTSQLALPSRAPPLV